MESFGGSEECLLCWPAGRYSPRYPGNAALCRVRLRSVDERARHPTPHLSAGEGLIRSSAYIS